MSTPYGDTRWWENYAVRYLMPSVAGMAIVKWICWHGDNSLLSLLNLPLEVREPGIGFETASLILLFLYGNLFCYVASYPVLVFHATRVLDFSNDRWRHHGFDGYIATSVLGILALGSVHYLHEYRRGLALALTLVFAALQVRRVFLVLAERNRTRMEGCAGIRGEDEGDVTLLYAYVFRLATRRGKREIRENTVLPKREVIRPDNDVKTSDERVTTSELKGEALWHKEYVETYRHLREHGNSAFIFVLELVLATLIYCVMIPNESGAKQLSAIGLLFAIWASPAVSVHLVGQFLERRFSHYEKHEIEPFFPARKVRPLPKK
jgi:hypothetical protein